MSPLDRPTFHEAWYRVAEMRPRLIPALQIYRQHYRGQRWHIVENPGSNEYFRLAEPAYRFVALLDGRRTVAEAWRTVSDDLGDDAPTQGEVIQLLGQLYTQNLLRGDVSADAAGMFERYRKRTSREVRNYLKNILFARIPIWDPDRFLTQWTPVFGWIFGPIGLLGWVALMLVGFRHLAGHWDELLEAADPQMMLQTENLVLLYLCFTVLKAVHELGHGFACKRFGRTTRSGGAVHTIGIMLLVFMPVPYVDASSAWAFRNRWHRLFVAAAGMYTELAVAAVAAIVWARTGEDTLVHALAYNVLFIASISTLLFNANPLLRYDGYYMLSDLIEMPNLSKRSYDLLKGLVRRFGFGVRKVHSVASTWSERIILFVYGWASLIYKVFIFSAILLYVADMFFFVGMIFAIVSVCAWFFVPIGKFLKYLATNSELDRTRGRAVAVTVICLGVLIGLFGFVPVPDHARTDGIVESRHQRQVHAMEDGFITEVLPSGSRVADATTLLAQENVDLLNRRRILLTQQDRARLRLQLALEHDPAQAAIVRRRLQLIAQQIERVEQRLSALTIRPRPTDHGVWIAEEAPHLPGRYVRRGEPIGMIVDLDATYVRAVADQYRGPVIADVLEGLGPVSIRLWSRPDVQMSGRVTRMVPAGQRELPSAALSQAMGGAIAVDPTQERPVASEPFFEFEIEPDAAGGPAPLLPGQRVVLRYRLPDKPLLTQGYLWLRQLLQERFQI